MKSFYIELLEEGGEALVVINLKRPNKCDSQKVLISHFPKAKDSSYFLIIGNPAKDDILAMKRVSFNRFSTKDLTISLPADFAKEKLELYLLCDSYIGLDQYHHIDLLNINAFIESKHPGAASKTLQKHNSEAIKAYEMYSRLQQEVLDDIFGDEAPLAKVSQGVRNMMEQDTREAA